MLQTLPWGNDDQGVDFKHPLGRITFPILPSVNELIACSLYNQRSFVSEWRQTGKIQALQEINSGRIDRFMRPVLVLVRVLRPDRRHRDVHNTLLKPILDGFTDAELWGDDSDHWVPTVILQVEPDAKSSEVIFEFYTIEYAPLLVKGRRR